MKLQIQFGSKHIQCVIERSQRKTLGISVLPDLNVVVRAPLEASVERIREKLLKRAPWIIKQQSYFLSFQPKTPPRRFVDGETHLYLGNQYRLKIEYGEPETVKLKGAFLTVITSQKSRAKKLVTQWYSQNAETKLLSIAKPLIKSFEKNNVAPSAIVIRSMNLRWGSCTANGKIMLNPELIKAPKACIEYVIIHELCHLIHHGHTQKFLDLQSREMPDWAKWKDKLEKLLA